MFTIWHLWYPDSMNAMKVIYDINKPTLIVLNSFFTTAKYMLVLFVHHYHSSIQRGFRAVSPNIFHPFQQQACPHTACWDDSPPSFLIRTITVVVLLHWENWRIYKTWKRGLIIQNWILVTIQLTPKSTSSQLLGPLSLAQHVSRRAAAHKVEIGWDCIAQIKNKTRNCIAREKNKTQGNMWCTLS